MKYRLIMRMFNALRRVVWFFTASKSLDDRLKRKQLLFACKAYVKNSESIQPEKRQISWK